ncbi:hypothetical protein [Nocardia arthritidis]|nr:hypothetical protein [Nocardia arthritidis]
MGNPLERINRTDSGIEMVAVELFDGLRESVRNFRLLGHPELSIGGVK